ncbi:MAG: formylglycine-generating enzyme family protein [Planctomycetaceae bacterium]
MVVQPRVLPTVLLLVTSAGCGSGTPDTSAVKQHMASAQLALGDPIMNSVGMVLVPIPDGKFKMGSQQKKKWGQDTHESPQHQVEITKPFYLSVCEVTQQQYAQVTGSRPWQGQPLVEEGAHYAATYVHWEDAAEFCQKLSDQEGVTYRLPTEAEWEYACRAGTSTKYSFGDDDAALGDYAWFGKNAYADGEQYAHRVGHKLPNPWGLYDMHGNVWEWCQDWFAGFDNQKKTKVVDPRGPQKGDVRVWRGGAFSDDGYNLRSATRLSNGRVGYRPVYLVGFRVARTFK